VSDSEDEEGVKLAVAGHLRKEAVIHFKLYGQFDEKVQ
jgi:hypothetical protein